jgi:hypothetical protein
VIGCHGCSRSKFFAQALRNNHKQALAPQYPRIQKLEGLTSTIAQPCRWGWAAIELVPLYFQQGGAIDSGRDDATRFRSASTAERSRETWKRNAAVLAAGIIGNYSRKKGASSAKNDHLDQLPLLLERKILFSSLKPK